MKPKAFFVVSAYNNDLSWIKDYTDNYVIYDKSNSLEKDRRVFKVKNVGYNIYDICHFILTYYHSLPELTAFLEGNPFDHCKKETFDKLIYREQFTSIEDYSHIKEEGWHKKSPDDGGYMELNNSWYIYSHRKTHGTETNRYFGSYNVFLDQMFEQPEWPTWVRFAPGGQYIVPKENILYYTPTFYHNLAGFVDYHRIPAEGHIIERALYYIFTNKWKERK